MAELLTNEFTEYALTEDEAIHGAIFTTTQLQVLQNRLSQAAQEKNILAYDATQELVFAQQEAYIRGRMDTLKDIIENSSAAQRLIIDKANPEFQNPI